MKRLLAIAMCLVAITSPAWEKIPATVSWLHVHHRVPAEPKADFMFRIAESDAMHYRFFKADISQESDYDMFNRNFVNLTVGHSDASGEITDSTLVFPLYNDGREQSGLSFRLSLVAPGRLKLEFGESESVYSYFINSEGKDLFFETNFSGKGEHLRKDSEIISTGDIRKSDFPTIADLYKYIEASANPIEGIWSHYDQDSPSLRVSSRHRYSFAVVSKGDRQYDIVFLKASGGELNPIWKPLDVKACFSETGFPGIFNLEWMDMDGRPVDTDATVQMTGDNMMTLRFPYWDTTVRYVKNELPK